MQEFIKAKQKAEALGLTTEQIKAALELFAYSNIALKVEFYLRDTGKLGIRKSPEKRSQDRSWEEIFILMTKKNK